jgi:cyclohexyl-isocyanide hydratase
LSEIQFSITMHINLIAFPRLTQLDMTAPLEVFARMPNTICTIVAETLDPIVSDCSLKILPDCTFEDAPSADILFVPGGPGINEGLTNERLIDFLKKQGSEAQYITSVCTGALLLARAGLLRGYKATTHWNALDLLAMLGAEVVQERVVIDRNRLTGGGVTAGIDFALVLAATLFGAATAQSIQCQLEYFPKPPFQNVDEKVFTETKMSLRNLYDIRRAIIEKL